MKRMITILILCIIMIVLVFLESCIDNIKYERERKNYQKIQEIEQKEDDTYFENWRYVLAIFKKEKDIENINKLKNELKEELKSKYNIEECKLTNLTYMNDIIRFDIILEQLNIYVSISKNDKNHYEYKYTVHMKE